MVHVLSNIGAKFDMFFIYFLWQHFGSLRIVPLPAVHGVKKTNTVVCTTGHVVVLMFRRYRKKIEAMSQSFPQHVVHGDLHRMVTSVVVHMSKCGSHRNHQMATKRVARISWTSERGNMRRVGSPRW